MNRAALSALSAHWRRHPVQLLTLVIGLALATGLWSAVQAINAEARASYAQASDRLGEGQTDVLLPAAGHIPLATYVAVRRAGWQVSPVLEGRTRIGNHRVTLVGIDPLNHPMFPALAQSDREEDQPDIAGFLGSSSVLFASPETARILLSESQGLDVRSTQAIPPGVVMTDIGRAERLLDQPARLSRLLVLPDQPTGLPPLSDVAPDLVLSKVSDEGDPEQLTGSFHLNLTAFGLLSFAVGLFIVHGTVGLAYEQRRPVIRTLRALGVPMRRLSVLMLAETTCLALIAGGLGLVMGHIVAAALLPDVAASLRGLYGASVEGTLSFRPIWAVSGMAMALVGAFLASAQALLRLARMPILAAPGAQGWARQTAKGARLQAIAGVALIVAGYLSLAVLDGLLAGFAHLAGLMLGAALILPACLRGALRLIEQRTTSPVAQWVWADMRMQLPGISLALMALLLALSANIGVGTMVHSFRLTFTGWLDQRLASDLYVTARTDRQGAELQAWLTPRVDAVLPIRYTNTNGPLGRLRIYGIVDHPTYREKWPLLASIPKVWDSIADGKSALINEQLARANNLWPGDTVTLAPGLDVPVGGVYSDYGNPNPQAIVVMDTLLSLAPDTANRQFGLRLPPDRIDALTAELHATFDLGAGAVQPQAAIKARSLEIFEKTFAVTGALNVLTLGVAAFAILTSLLTLWTLRLPQIAPVWALGLTRARLSRLEVLRSMALAGMTAVLAVPLGLVLAHVLLSVINVRAFGWQLPMMVFPGDWLILGGLSLIAAALAAAIPARRLLLLPPARLLGVFANER